MTQTLTNLDALLKNVYRGPIVELLNQDTYLLDQLEQTNANDMGAFTGRQLIFPTHTARNHGRGYTTDGGGLAPAGGQSYLDGIVTLKYWDGGVELTDQVIKQSEKDEGAFVRALTSEMEGASNDMRKDITRAMYGTGDGLLATVTGTPAGGTSITVDSGQFIAVGDTVDILVKTTGATTNGVVGTVVTAVTFTGAADSSTQTAATLTIGTTTAGATSNLYGVYISGDRNNETDGLRNILSTGRTLHQINSSTYPVWDSNVISLNYSKLSEDACMRLAQTIAQRAGKRLGRLDAILTTYGVQRRLANQYTSQKRFNDAQAVKIEGGYSAINVSAGDYTVPVVSDTDCPAGYAFGLNKAAFAWAEQAKPDWLEAPDGKGSIFHLKDGSTAGSKVLVWQAWMVWYATLVNLAPLRGGAINQCADDIPVVRL